MLGSLLPGAHTPTATLDRARAAEERVRAREDPLGAARASVLVQLASQLGGEIGHSVRQRTRPFRVRLAGEASDDLGGPFREAIAEACLDLSSGAASLLCPTPNAASGVGAHRDAWLPKPAAASARELRLFEFIGALVGSALRHDEPLMDLQLAPPVWRALRSGVQTSSELALRETDAALLDSLAQLRALGESDVLTDAELASLAVVDVHTANLSSGEEVELFAAGARTHVRAAQLSSYCARVAAARARESAPQLAALRAGLLQCVPARALALWAPAELERIACGEADVSVDALRAHTRYGEGVDVHETHVRYFWQTMHAFSPQERAAFLRFTWGRSRLPSGASAWKDQWFRIHTMESVQPDSRLPVAHTCFFSMELPRYSSARVCYQRLQYAVLNCVDIDADTSGNAVANARLQRLESTASGESDEHG
mmetsp:Transcript_4802/g.11584  ORF Transcript_4802/g.11584 Transcript_4802/m.11584 type:complete len:429 (+) Transcript_4802:1012-2298(+)